WKVGVGAQYEQTVGSGGTMALRADYVWQDEMYFSAFNVPVLHESSFGWAKARLMYTGAAGTWSIAAFVDNATNEKVATNKIFDGDISGSIVAGSLAPPRTYGIEFTLRN